MRRLLKFYGYVIGCFWITVGVCFMALLRHPAAFSGFAWVTPLLFGPASILAGLGLFRGWRWTRWLLGTLASLFLLYALDMVLFLAFRGYHGQDWVPSVLALLAGSGCTWLLILFSSHNWDSPGRPR